MVGMTERRRLTKSLRTLCGVLMLSLVLGQIPVSLSAAGNDCSGMPHANTGVAIAAAGETGAGCAHSVGCGLTVCCTGAAPALSQGEILQIVPVGVTAVIPPSDTRVSGFLQAGPPTPPPNS
jgi:hypothetical protein